MNSIICFKIRSMKYLFAVIVLVFSCGPAFSQAQQAADTGIDLLTTCGNMSITNSETADCSRILFIVVPEHHVGAFYVRVFDPDCGGEHDSSNGLWETNTEFEVYGGAGCICVPGAGNEQVSASVASGILLDKKLFANEPGIDGTWVTFGPFTSAQGEKREAYDARFFKLIVGGKTGDDRNHYAVVLSSSGDQNKEINGASIYKDTYAFNEDLQKGKYNYSVNAEPVE